jgi:transposase
MVSNPYYKLSKSLKARTQNKVSYKTHTRIPSSRQVTMQINNLLRFELHNLE